MVKVTTGDPNPFVVAFVHPTNCVSLGTVGAPSVTLRADSVTTLVNGNVFE